MYNGNILLTAACGQVNYKITKNLIEHEVDVDIIDSSVVKYDYCKIFSWSNISMLEKYDKTGSNKCLC